MKNLLADLRMSYEDKNTGKIITHIFILTQEQKNKIQDRLFEMRRTGGGTEVVNKIAMEILDTALYIAQITTPDIAERDIERLQKEHPGEKVKFIHDEAIITNPVPPLIVRHNTRKTKGKVTEIRGKIETLEGGDKNDK